MVGVVAGGRRRRTVEEVDDARIASIVNGNQFHVATGLYDPIPPAHAIRDELSKPPINIRDRTFRLIKVEDLGDYKIFIQVPGDKTEYDFYVWRAIYEGDRLVDLKIPSYDDLGNMYLDLKKSHTLLDEFLINATLRFIRDRYKLKDVINTYFANLDKDLVRRLERFLLTLKWIAIQEDANYPPPRYLGSLYSLSVFAVLEVTGSLQSVRKIIRFRAR